MAAFLFNEAREGFLSGAIDWDTATIKVALVRGTLPASSSTATTVADLTGAGLVLVQTSAALTGKTVADGVADAADVTFTAVPSGDPITGILVFQSSAVGGGADVAAGSQRVIAFSDQYTGLPVTPNGGDITIQWDSGANAIYRL